MQKRKKSEEPKIIYQDEVIAVLEKPAGWIVNRAETTKESTLQDWIEKNLELKIKNLKFYRSGIVHRLDKDTSGLIVVGKTPDAFLNLQGQFKERNVFKKYLALVHGKMELQEGIITAPITRSPFDRKKFGIFLGGKEAETRYKVVDYYFLFSGKKKEDFSLLELIPKTGRTHQIRVHLKYIGHPVVSDDFYAGRKTNRSDRRWCPRQFLHSSVIRFFHPQTGKKIEFYSPLPQDLKNALKYLKK